MSLNVGFEHVSTCPMNVRAISSHTEGKAIFSAIAIDRYLDF